MSKNNDTNKSNLLETVLYVASTLAMLVVTQQTSINQNKKSDRHEINENVYHIHATPFTDPKSAKDYAKLAAKLQEAERETDDYWRVRQVQDIAESLEDKNDCIKAYAITELTRIASNTDDDYWRGRMLDAIDEI